MRFFPLFMLLLSPLLLRSESYLWPTDASHMMSSSFCEYRDRHFHAGIDIKTRGEEGFDVYAVESGYVSRILVSPYGYGKAVYLKLNDGNTVVYGHLSRFSQPLERYVEEKQQAMHQYRQDLNFSSGTFQVDRGDLLGYTGSTGIGVPHLHFEVRDRQDHPFNPFLLGYRVLDSRPPVIQAIAFSPLGYGSHVAGDFIPKIIRVNGHDPDDSIPVWGEIGVAVSAFDRADGAWNKFSPYILRLFVDDSLRFQTRYQRFSYTRTDQIDLDRDAGLKKRGYGEFINLYKHPENGLSFYTPETVNAGILNCRYPPFRQFPENLNPAGRVLTAGVHRIRIEAEDYWGNLRSVSTKIEVVPLHDLSFHEPAGSAEAAPRNGAGLDTEWNHDYVRFQLTGCEQNHPRLLVWLNGSLQADRPMRTVSGEGNIAILPLNPDFEGNMVIRIIDAETGFRICGDTLEVVYADRRGVTWISPDRRFQCSVPPDAVSEPTWFHIEQEKTNAASRTQYRICPDDRYLKRPLTIRIRIPRHKTALRGAGIGAAGRRGFTWLPTGIDSAQSMLTAYTRDLRKFTVLQDTVPPELITFRPDSLSMQHAGPVELSMTFRDTMSGFSDESQYRFLIDGRPQVLAYDPEKDFARTEISPVLQAGDHELEIILEDRAGNITRRRCSFRVVE